VVISSGGGEGESGRRKRGAMNLDEGKESISFVGNSEGGEQSAHIVLDRKGGATRLPRKGLKRQSEGCGHVAVSTTGEQFARPRKKQACRGGNTKGKKTTTPKKALADSQPSSTEGAALGCLTPHEKEAILAAGQTWGWGENREPRAGGKVPRQ